MSNFTYISKPVCVEAFRFDDLNTEKTVAIAQWAIKAVMNGTVAPSKSTPDVWYCQTRQGLVVIKAGDYLIKLADGEIYPCSAEVFEQKYEKVPDAKPE